MTYLFLKILKFENSNNLIGRESFWANTNTKVFLKIGWVCNRKVKITRTCISNRIISKIVSNKFKKQNFSKNLKNPILIHLCVSIGLDFF